MRSMKGNDDHQAIDALYAAEEFPCLPDFTASKRNSNSGGNLEGRILGVDLVITSNTVRS